MSRKGVPPERAEDAFSLYYGHVPLLGTRHLHEPFREYADWLRSRQLAHTPERFRDWVAHDYRADDPLVELVPLPAGPRPPRSARLTGRPDGFDPAQDNLREPREHRESRISEIKLDLFVFLSVLSVFSVA